MLLGGIACVTGEGLVALSEEGMCSWDAGCWHSLEAVLCPGFTMWPCEPAHRLPEGTCWLILP